MNHVTGIYKYLPWKTSNIENNTLFNTILLILTSQYTLFIYIYYLVQGVMCITRSQQFVSIERGIQATGTWCYMFFFVTQQLYKSTSFDFRYR